jgi:hypothetical protein
MNALPGQNRQVLTQPQTKGPPITRSAALFVAKAERLLALVTAMRFEVEDFVLSTFGQ